LKKYFKKHHKRVALVLIICNLHCAIDVNAYSKVAHLGFLWRSIITKRMKKYSRKITIPF
jgi:hypothetical protein